MSFCNRVSQLWSILFTIKLDEFRSSQSLTFSIVRTLYTRTTIQIKVELMAFKCQTRTCTIGIYK